VIARPHRPPLSRAAIAWLGAVAAAALGWSAYAIVTLSADRTDMVRFALLAVGAAAAQLLGVRTVRNQRYHPSVAIVVAGAFLLPAGLLPFLVLAQHLPEWVRLRHPWYIGAFNAGNYVIDLLATAALTGAVLDVRGTDARWLVAGLGGALFFVALNHGLLAVMLKLARGHSLRASGLFSPAGFATDLTPAVLGVLAAWFWLNAPALVLLALLPLALIYRSLALSALGRAEEELATRARQQAAVAALGIEALAGAPADDIMIRAVALVTEALDGDYVAVFERGVGGSLKPRAATGWAAELDAPLGANGLSFPPGSGELPPLLSETGLRSGTSASISTADGPFGLLGAYVSRPRTFSTDDGNFLQAVANVIGLSLSREGAQQALADSEERRQQLLDMMLRAGEEERVRIAAELHDDTIQVMTASLIGMDRAAKAVEAGDTGRAQSAIGSTRRTVASAVERTRRLTFELRPPLLEANGLEAAVADIAEQAGEDGGFRVETLVDVGRHSAPTEDLIYRIVLEAVTNVRKHASASNVRIVLRERLGGISGLIRDDGRGFDAARDRAGSRFHVGLDAMNERIRLAGGRMTIRSAPGRGTVIGFHVPSVSCTEEQSRTG
jgi:signal transduction histidine kinase